MIEVLLLQAPVLLLAVAVHVLGHRAAARAAGPPRPDRLRAAHALAVAGGPVASLALAAGALAAAVLAGGPFLWASAVTVAAAAGACLLPAPGRVGWGDGRWLLAWLREPERAAQRIGLAGLQRAQDQGVRPRDWDAGWARLAAAGARHPADRAQVQGCLLAYAWAFDRGEMDRAAALLGRAFAARRLLPDRDASAIALENAFFVARCRGNHALAARLLEAEGRTPPRGARFERARAAVHLAAGRLDDALAACERALLEHDRSRTGRSRHSRRATALLEREVVVAMRDEALRRARVGAPSGSGGTAG